MSIGGISEEFYSALVSAGSLVKDCGFCGRTHFCTYHTEINCYDEGELEDLRAKAEADPDKYIECSEFSSIEWGILFGKDFVIGCPCDSAVQYEKAIWSARWLIRDFFKNKAERIKKDAEIEIKNCEEITQAVKEKE